MYRMDTHDGSQMAAEDPFGGNGVFLAHDGSGQQIIGRLEGVFGLVPAVTWPGRGAWVDISAMDIPGEEASARWEAAVVGGP
jgi:hypothetical protein